MSFIFLSARYCIRHGTLMLLFLYLVLAVPACGESARENKVERAPADTQRYSVSPTEVKVALSSLHHMAGFMPPKSCYQDAACFMPQRPFFLNDSKMSKLLTALGVLAQPKSIGCAPPKLSSGSRLGLAHVVCSARAKATNGNLLLVLATSFILVTTKGERAAAGDYGATHGSMIDVSDLGSLHTTPGY